MVFSLRNLYDYLKQYTPYSVRYQYDNARQRYAVIVEMSRHIAVIFNRQEDRLGYETNIRTSKGDVPLAENIVDLLDYFSAVENAFGSSAE